LGGIAHLTVCCWPSLSRLYQIAVLECRQKKKTGRSCGQNPGKFRCSCNCSLAGIISQSRLAYGGLRPIGSLDRCMIGQIGQKLKPQLADICLSTRPAAVAAGWCE